MKLKWLMGVAALQVLALVYMAGNREWVLRAGRTVWLRTAPVDPRDVMRGDYVRLDYEFSRVPRSLWRGRVASTNEYEELVPPGTKVFASLQADEDGIADLVSLSPKKPAEGLFIRGRTEASYGSVIQVRYGLEALFVEQGKGMEIERGRTQGDARVPLEVRAAVSRGGAAVLKDYRWSALGIGLELKMKDEPGAATQRQRRAVGATVKLLNASSNDVAVVDLPGGRSLTLVPDTRWQENLWHWSPPDAGKFSPEPGQVIVLKPGQSHAIRVDFNEPRWSVLKEDERLGTKAAPVKLVEMPEDWSARFRLQYRPPARVACSNLPNANLIWHGCLTSRSFNMFGTTD